MALSPKEVERMFVCWCENHSDHKTANTTGHGLNTVARHRVIGDWAGRYRNIQKIADRKVARMKSDALASMTRRIELLIFKNLDNLERRDGAGTDAADLDKLMRIYLKLTGHADISLDGAFRTVEDARKFVQSLSAVDRDNLAGSGAD